MKTELLEGLTLEPGNPIGAKSRAQAGPKGNDKQSALEVTEEGDMERKPGGGSEHGALYPCLPGSIHSSPLPCVTGAGSPLSLGPLQASLPWSGPRLLRSPALQDGLAGRGVSWSFCSHWG